MQTFALVLGILAILGMLAGFLPCFGALNWINIPVAVIVVIIAAIALGTAPPDVPKGKAIGGLVLCLIAVVFGGIRLLLGGGVV